MTWEQFMLRQQSIMSDLRTRGDIFGRAVQATHVKYLNRIFVEGLTSNGTRIGYYSSSGKISIPKRKGLPGGGKTYESYLDYRRAIGRETKYVNLRLTGDLQNDWRTSLRRVTAIKWVASPKRKINIVKSIGNSKRYDKKIFQLSSKEEEYLADIFSKELERELNKL